MQLVGERQPSSASLLFVVFFFWAFWHSDGNQIKIKVESFVSLSVAKFSYVSHFENAVLPIKHHSFWQDFGIPYNIFGFALCWMVSSTAESISFLFKKSSFLHTKVKFQMQSYLYEWWIIFKFNKFLCEMVGKMIPNDVNLQTNNSSEVNYVTACVNSSRKGILCTSVT